MRVDVWTALPPFCQQTATLHTLPPNELPDSAAEVCSLHNLLHYADWRRQTPRLIRLSPPQEELRLGIWHTAQECSHVDRRGSLLVPDLPLLRAGVGVQLLNKRTEKRTQHKLSGLDCS